MRGAVAAVVALAAWLPMLDGGARAADDDEEASIRRGVELRKRGDDRAALPEFERAYRLARSPRAAAQLGFAEQALAMWPQAETHVSESLRATDDPWINKNRAVIEESLRTIRSHVGRIEIAGGRPGAAVAVNGQRVGTMPLTEPIAVSAGPVDVEVKAAGYAPAVKTVNVAAGEYARVAFTLVADRPPGAAPLPGAPAVSAPPAMVSATPVAAADVGAGAGDVGRGRRMAALGIGAAGVAAIGAGIACTLVGRNKFDAINDDAAADRPYDESNGNWKTYETAAVALYVVGGAALVTGSLLYLKARRGETSTTPTMSLRPVIAPSRAGASLSVRF